MRRHLFAGIVVLAILTLTTATGHAFPDGSLGTNCSMCHSNQSPPNNPPPPPANNQPMADAGFDQTVAVGDTVSLDGSGSSDVDGDSLTFQWLLASVPGGSRAVLSDPTSANPTFVADVPGEYLVELVVNDGQVDSGTATVTINTGNSPPKAVISLNQPPFTGNIVNLDGSGSSDADGDPLTFQWSLISVPAGSAASLSDPALPDPTFVADVAGDYTVGLIVSDGQQDSAPSVETLTVVLGESPAADPPAPVVDQPSGGEPPAPSVGESSTTEPTVSADEETPAGDDNSLQNDDGESERSLRRENNSRRKHRRRYYRSTSLQSRQESMNLNNRSRNRGRDEDD